LIKYFNYLDLAEIIDSLPLNPWCNECREHAYPPCLFTIAVY